MRATNPPTVDGEEKFDELTTERGEINYLNLLRGVYEASQVSGSVLLSRKLTRKWKCPVFARGIMF